MTGSVFIAHNLGAETVNTDRIREKLQDMRQGLEERQTRIAKHTRHRDEPLSADFAEQATELENGETLVALDRECQEEISRIDQALKRLADGTYSTCVTCGGEIAEKRLEAIPHASQCIDCASRD
jgi:RNA polymerase-binding protein DksA